MAKNSWDYNTRILTDAQIKKWKVPVMTEAEKKVAQKDPWFNTMMDMEIVPKGKTKHADVKLKKGKRAAKVVEKYLKEKNTAVVKEKKPRGRPKKKGK